MAERDSRSSLTYRGCRFLLFFPLSPSVCLIASTTAPRSACAPTLSSLCPSPSLAFVLDLRNAGAGAGATSGAPRTAFRPITSSNSASISSGAAPRLRFSSSFTGEDFPGVSSSRPSCSSVGTVPADGTVYFNLILLAGFVVAPLDDGVACWRRHSSGLRWRSDNASPRVKNCARGEPARRAACDRSPRASFS